MTATCCALHVLNMLLKDVAAIPEVASVMDYKEAILRVYWGRSRWPRTKLCEVTRRNHGIPLGLYKAKVTRFGGKVNALRVRCMCATCIGQLRRTCPGATSTRSESCHAMR